MSEEIWTEPTGDDGETAEPEAGASGPAPAPAADAGGAASMLAKARQGAGETVQRMRVGMRKPNMVPALLVAVGLLGGGILSRDNVTVQVGTGASATPESVAKAVDDEEHTLPAPEPTASTAHAAGADVHWTYEGGEGPQHWAELSDEYAECADGSAQSPIDIVRPAVRDLSDIAFNYLPAKAELTNNGHTAMASFSAGMSIVLDGTRYALVQAHMHEPSEHTINGQSYPGELHLVHKSTDGKLAVIGIFLRTGERNEVLDEFFNETPDSGKAAAEIELDLTKLLPTDQRTVRYHGSLTTPPCTEGVAWNLILSPVTASKEQLKLFSDHFPDGNARPTQPLHGRQIVVDETIDGTGTSAKHAPTDATTPATGDEEPAAGAAGATATKLASDAGEPTADAGEPTADADADGDVGLPADQHA